ncbi:MAG: thiosulfate/3-mercaptopyruvate sulfurtransferase [Gammaproteobacteria bacterium]|jgi:thiosulfate/3-mercaptopyruvate sulfurtransferase
MFESFVVTTNQVHAQLADVGAALIVDMRSAQDFAAGHVPGAVHVLYDDIVRAEPPVGGLLPLPVTLARLFGAIGLSADRDVIAYDDDGNGKSGRLVWTLSAAGHVPPAAIMDGGFAAWCEQGFAVQTEVTPIKVTRYEFSLEQGLGLDVIADGDWIGEHLRDPEVRFLDVRTPAEYSGEDVRSARGGHIPGAVNFNWLLMQDAQRHKALRAREELLAELAAVGITPDKEIVAYCQTHQRSSHTFVVLKWLGFTKVRGYPGAWSDWGNAPDTPIVSGDSPA